MTVETAYLDASAAVKLVRAEPQTPALIARLQDAPVRVSSAVLDVELRCFAHRHGRPRTLADVDALLSAIDLLPFTDIVRARAGMAFEPPQRALDAIHIATALDLDAVGLIFVTYEGRQAQAGGAAGLEVVVPR